MELNGARSPRQLAVPHYSHCLSSLINRRHSRIRSWSCYAFSRELFYHLLRREIGMIVHESLVRH
jgi:hypothetical protein